jgi:hypothetical protein
MDQVTQQNAALVEEAAAAASSLQEQAGSLVQVVSVFKLGSDGEAAQVIAQAQSAGSAPAKTPKARAKVLTTSCDKQASSAPQLAVANGAAGEWAEF